MFNKKGQLGFLKIIAFAILFIILFSLGLAPFISSVLGTQNLSVYGGLGQMLLGSFNLIILLAFFILVISAIVLGINTGGSSQ